VGIGEQFLVPPGDSVNSISHLGKIPWSLANSFYCHRRCGKLDISDLGLPTTTLLLFGEDLVASPWVELRALPSSNGAHGRAPLELDFWSEGGSP
jgi:hypothetical protein